MCWEVILFSQPNLAFLGNFDPVNIFNEQWRKTVFRGDLTDISAETKTPVLSCEHTSGWVPISQWCLQDMPWQSGLLGAQNKFLLTNKDGSTSSNSTNGGVWPKMRGYIMAWFTRILVYPSPWHWMTAKYSHISVVHRCFQARCWISEC